MIICDIFIVMDHKGLQRESQSGVQERKLIELGPKKLDRRLMNPLVSGSSSSLDAFDLSKNFYSNAYYKMNRIY